MKVWRSKHALILLVLFWLYGCMPGTGQNLTATDQDSQIPSPTVSPTIRPSKVPNTVTASPSLQPTDTPRPPTPLPTLTPEEIRTLVLELVRTNGDCALPCIWGLEIGETKEQGYQGFIDQFYEIETDDFSTSVWVFEKSRLFDFVFAKGGVYILVALAEEYNQDRAMFIMSASALREYGTTPEGALDLRPQYGDPYFNETLQYYTLSNILTVYGPPERVLVATWPDDPEYTPITTWPFSLVLLYQEQGIFLEYESVREIDGSNFVGCPSKSQIHVGVWDPKQSLPLYYIAEKAGAVINDLNYSYFKPLEEATEFTVEGFYETFKDPHYSGCLETPANLWSP